MRTTIDLPEELFREVKIRAAREGSTLKELITECIRSGLQRPSAIDGNSPIRRGAPPVAIRRTPGMAPTAALSNRQLSAILENEEVASARNLASHPDRQS